MNPQATSMVILLWTASQVSAQGIANYNDIILGARAASLGGAFTAVADDTTAAYHNPAGLADSPARGLSLSVSAYGYQRTVHESLFSSPSHDVDLVLDSVLFYPGLTGYVLPLGGEDDPVKHVLALTVVAPRFFEIEGVQNLSLPEDGIELDVFENRVQRMLWAGPSYAVRAGPVSFGSSVYLQYATFREQVASAIAVYVNDSTGASAASRSLDFKYANGTYFGLTANLGVLFHLGAKARVGLNVQMPSLRLGGKTRSFFVEAASVAVFDGSSRLTDVALYQDIYRQVEGKTEIRVPWTFSLGYAHEIGTGHLISLDVDAYLPIEEHDFVTGTGQIQVPYRPGEVTGLDSTRGFDGRLSESRRRWVLNGSLGAQARVARDYDLLFGFYTDISSIGADAISEHAQINMLGASLGARRRGRDSSLTIGVTGRYGWGQVMGVNVQPDLRINDALVDARQWSVSVVVGGSKMLSDPQPSIEREEASMTEDSTEPGPTQESH